MQFLSFTPGSAVAVFAQMFDHGTYVFQIPNTRLPMPEPKAFRVTLYQGDRVLHQFRRSWGRLGKFLELCGHWRCAAHE